MFQCCRLSGEILQRRWEKHHYDAEAINLPSFSALGCLDQVLRRVREEVKKL